MKKCPNCGAETGDFCTSCGVCGASLNEADTYTLYGIPKPKSRKIESGENVHTNKKAVVQPDNKVNTPKKQTENIIKLDSAAKIQGNPSETSDEGKTFKQVKDAAKNNAAADNLEEGLKKQKPSGTADVVLNDSSNNQKSKNFTPVLLKEKKPEDSSKNSDEAASIYSNQNYYDDDDFEELDYEELLDKPNFIEFVRGICKPLANKAYKFLFNRYDETSEYDSEDIVDNSNFAIISYVPFLFFVPMIVKPYSGYLRFHGNQGLNLFLTSACVEIANIILNLFFGAIFTTNGALSGFGIFLTVFFTVLLNASILLWIAVGIANAVKGKARELPFIGKFRILK